eukprot:jgi/Mesvir1/16080/Mv08374-RA.1
MAPIEPGLDDAIVPALAEQEDGVLRDFRRGLATDEDVKEFPRACKGMSDDALGEYLHTLKAAVVDCPVVEILCDIFELGPEDPDGMSPGERHAACWQKVDTADDVNDLCKSVETRMVCATGKIFNLIAEVEERRGQGLEVWMDTLFFAHSRVFPSARLCAAWSRRASRKRIAPSARTRSPWGGVSAAGPQLSVRGRCELANDLLCELGIRRFATTDDVLELGNGLLLGLLTLWLIRRGADSS